MRSWVAVGIIGVALGFAASTGARAQDVAQPAAGVGEPDASIGAALENLASRAATVFAGQVISIQRQGGVVAIVFHVFTPVVGEVGATYTLREWAGMWPPGEWRYTVGERALVFLHGNSSAGLSSAVDGGDGIVPLVGDANGTPLLDVRRLGTRVLRQVGQPLPGSRNGAITLADAVQLIHNWRTGGGREPVRRPLPPGLGVTPRRSAGAPAQQQLQVVIRPRQQGPVRFVLQRGADAAQ